ncbi:MAG: glycosyltransferase family 2 protein [Gammaproteobacteria bacterium]|nr:MAG: glycosyltransferase family 2 protein [Gammaproteobacteria bacterium]
MSQNPASSLAGSSPACVCVVVPCYGVGESILELIGRIGPEATRIYVVDDACPKHTGDCVEQHCRDDRVRVLRHDTNQGVGGAVITGYRAAIRDGCDVAVKLDGDGQMDPALIHRFVLPIVERRADYTKGNRFYYVESAYSMPPLRMIGNVALSFLSKISSGYWKIFDPTNGYTAVHTKVLQHLPLDKIARGYFFESDMLFRLGLLRAKVLDISMASAYGEEESHLRIARVVPVFLASHLRNFGKRVVYTYFMRDFQMASLGILLGIPMILFGLIFGLGEWLTGSVAGVFASPGTVMVASLPILLGSELLLLAIGQDIANQPTETIYPDL